MNLDLLNIRVETPEDCAVIRAVTIAAFANSEYGHNGEAELIEVLRDSSARYLSLVGSIAGEVVGHALFTPVTIRSSQRETEGMGLAPMSVIPGRQKSGIGTALLEHGIDRLWEDGCPFVVVAGHPSYYSRFGFRPAAEYGVSHGFSGIPQEVFFIRCGSKGILEGECDARAFYQPEFGPQHND